MSYKIMLNSYKYKTYHKNCNYSELNVNTDFQFYLFNDSSEWM